MRKRSFAHRLPLLTFSVGLSALAACGDHEPDGCGGLECASEGGTSEEMDSDGSDSDPDSETGEPESEGPVSVEEQEPDIGEDCPGIELGTSQVLDLDLKAVRLSGTVTIEGLPLDEVGVISDRGELHLHNLDDPTLVGEAWLNELGGGYELLVPPGRYRLEYLPSNSWDQFDPQLPATPGVLVAELELVHDQELDFDLQPVLLTGNLTHFGDALPSTGTLALRSRTDDPAYALRSEGLELQTSLLPSFEIPVFPDTYELVWINDHHGCAGGGRICGNQRVAEELEVYAPTEFDLNLDTLDLSGTLTLDGAPLPTQGVRAQVMLTSDEGSSPAGWLGLSGDEYAISLLPGRYDLQIVPHESDCHEDESPLPCVPYTLVKDLEVQSSKVLDLDIALARVEGTLRLLGAPAPDDTSVEFRGRNGVRVRAQTSHEGEETHYSASLYPGEYDVVLLRNGGCDEGLNTSNIDPCLSAVLETGVEIVAGPSVRDIDVQLIQVDTSLFRTDDPEDPLPWAIAGALRFVGEDGSLADPGANGRILLPPGTWQPWWMPSWDIDCDSYYPCLRTPLGDFMELDGSTELDLWLNMITVSGTLTLNGAPLPEEADFHGRLLMRHGEARGAEFVFDVDSGEGSNYSVDIAAGAYMFAHLAAVHVCDLGASMPCSSQVLACGD